MKKLVLLFLFATISLFAQNNTYNWVNPSPAPYMLYDIFFLNDLDGWAVGEFSTVIKTTNGGLSWQPVSIPLRSELSKVYFTDEKNGWIIGGDPAVPSWGAILKTTNGGVTWKNYQPNINYSYSFLDITFPTKNTGYIAGFEGIFKTNDAGETWSNTGGTGWATSVYFIDSLTGWGTNPIGRIIKTTNGAASWDSLYEFHWQWNKRIKFYNENIGWVVGGGLYEDYGVIYKTTDGGSNWMLQDSSLTGAYLDIEIIDTLNAIVSGENGQIRYTSDGGENWFYSSSNKNENLYGIAANKNAAWVVGGNYEHPVIIKSGLEFRKWDNELNLITENELKSISFSSNDNGWLCGLNGSLFNTTDGGNTWKSKDLFNIDFYSVSTFGENYIFAGGGSGEFIKSTDMGETWIVKNIQQPINFDFENHKIQFFSPNYGYSGVTDNQLLKTTDGGETWNQVLDFINDYQFVDSLHGWALNIPVIIDIWKKISDVSQLMITTDGGDSWENVEVEAYIDKIFFLNQEIGWLSDGYNLLKTIDGGHNWEIINTDATRVISEIYFLNENEGYLVGLDNDNSLNTIYKTNDSGSTFTKIKTLTEIKYLTSNGKDIIGIGSKGQIIKIDRTSTDVHENQLFKPKSFYLSQNYPNPFNPITTINYKLPKDGKVTLKVYDILGKEIFTLVSGNKNAGSYQVNFDAHNLASGVYYYQLKVGEYLETKKMVVLK